MSFLRRVRSNLRWSLTYNHYYNPLPDDHSIMMPTGGATDAYAERATLRPWSTEHNDYSVVLPAGFDMVAGSCLAWGWTGQVWPIHQIHLGYDVGGTECCSCWARLVKQHHVQVISDVAGIHCVSKKRLPFYTVKTKSISIILVYNILAHLTWIMFLHYLVKRKSSWYCLPESRPHTQHINRLLSEPPTYYWRRLIGLS